MFMQGVVWWLFSRIHIIIYKRNDATCVYCRRVTFGISGDSGSDGNTMSSGSTGSTNSNHIYQLSIINCQLSRQ